MPDQQQQPTVGQTVHYVSYGTPGGEFASQCRAAVVAEVPGLVRDPETNELKANSGRSLVNVCVLNPTGIFFNQVAHSATLTGGTWHTLEECPDA